MPTSLSEDRSPSRSSATAGHYWASRKWYYDWKYAPSGSKKREEVELPMPRPRQRQEGMDQPGLGNNPPDARVRQCLREIEISKNGTLTYSRSGAGLEVPMRPMARRLLVVMCSASGRAVSLADMCQALWARSTPASISAMHTTVFRANDTLLRARCPLRIGIQDQWATITYTKLARQSGDRSVSKKTVRPARPLGGDTRFPNSLFSGRPEGAPSRNKTEMQKSQQYSRIRSIDF